MNKKVVHFKKNGNKNGGGKMETILSRKPNLKPVQKSKSIVKFIELRKNNFSRCDDVLDNLFEAGKEFKDSLGLSDKDVYDLMRKRE